MISASSKERGKNEAFSLVEYSFTTSIKGEVCYEYIIKRKLVDVCEWIIFLI